MYHQSAVHRHNPVRNQLGAYLRTRTLVSLFAAALISTLASCGIANDSVPRDIDPAKLESLKPTP
jgi:hypothetical protein